MAALIALALGWLKSIAGPILKALTDWRVLAVIALAAVMAWALLGRAHEAHRADLAEAALKAEKVAFADEKRAFAAERAHSAAVEAARGKDHAAATHSATDADKACSARVATARRSASAITHLLNEPPHANPDPREPELLSARQLRDALGR
jgi:C4-dicarboxylate-specific signal transduction histidine kinase